METKVWCHFNFSSLLLDFACSWCFEKCKKEKLISTYKCTYKIVLNDDSKHPHVNNTYDLYEQNETMSDDAEESAITDFLHILEEHRKNCEQQGKYVEAEIAKNRLLEIKAHEENRQMEAMKARQIGEMLGVEEAHMLEFQQFNLCWDTKMSEYEEKSEGLISNMQERHDKEFQEFQTKLSSKQQKPKFSTDLLNYRKIEEHLVKSKDYSEAHKTKIKADDLESIETERWVQRRKKDNSRLEKQFRYTKEQELSALMKRIQAGRQEHEKQRQIALERLLQRYQNVKKELEAQQNMERIHRDKQLTSCGNKAKHKGGRRDNMKRKNRVKA